MNIQLRFLCILILLTILVACLPRSPLPTYYVLSAPPTTQTDGKISQTIITGPIVEIESVTIPGYLDQPQVFIRDKQSVVVQFAEFHRWSESLIDGVSRVLQKTISNSLVPIGGLAVGASTTQSDWALTLNIFRFDGAPNEDVFLDAMWTLRSAKYKISRTGRFTESLKTGSTITDMVRTQGILLEQLGVVIGNEVQNQLPYELCDK